jgi:tetratricopeptide (TPR) repeat protein
MAIEPQLDTLEAKGLIRLAAYQPELEYLFKHWLVQDAAYGSLLKQERRALHRLVGEALEALYPDRGAELAGVLAMHFEYAGDTSKAIDYLLAAGRHALAGNAIKEAFAAFERADELLAASGALEDDVLRRRRAEIALGKARAGISFRRPEEVIADLVAVLPDAELVGDLRLVADIHLTLSLTRLQSGELPSEPDVKLSLERVTAIGEELGDPSLRAMPLALTGLSQTFSGPVRAGVSALEEAVPLLQQRQDYIGAAFARGALAMGYAELGEFEKAEAASRNATELAESGDQIARLDASIAESFIEAARGQLDRAGPLALQCLGRAEEMGATACVMPSAWVLGDVYHRQGRFAEARQMLERAHEVSLLVDRKVWRPTIQAWLGSSAAALGDKAAADGNWDEALAVARAGGNRLAEATIRAKRAEAHARLGDWQGSLADFEASTATLEAEGTRPRLARALRAWGEALRAGERAQEGDVKLRKALALFEEMGLSEEAAAVRASL